MISFFAARFEERDFGVEELGVEALRDRVVAIDPLKQTSLGTVMEDHMGERGVLTIAQLLHGTY